MRLPPTISKTQFSATKSGKHLIQPSVQKGSPKGWMWRMRSPQIRCAFENYILDVDCYLADYRDGWVWKQMHERDPGTATMTTVTVPWARTSRQVATTPFVQFTPSHDNLRRVDATVFHLADEEPEAERASPPCAENDPLPPLGQNSLRPESCPWRLSPHILYSGLTSPAGSLYHKWVSELTAWEPHSLSHLCASLRQRPKILAFPSWTVLPSSSQGPILPRFSAGTSFPDKPWNSGRLPPPCPSPGHYTLYHLFDILLIYLFVQPFFL